MENIKQAHLKFNGSQYILILSDRCLSIKMVANKLDVSLSHAKKHIVTLPDFPPAIRYEPQSHPKWLESDIDAWLNTKKG